MLKNNNYETIIKNQKVFTIYANEWKTMESQK